MEYGELYIVPDENKILGNVFHKKISNNHLMGIQEFSDKYKLGYHFEKGEYQEAPCILARDGMLVAKTVDSAGILIFYIPEIISDNQCMWYRENMMLFSKYSTIGAYFVKDTENGYHIDEKSDMNVNQLYLILNQKNMLYDKNKIGKSH